jgi:hypothetical protein
MIVTDGRAVARDGDGHPCPRVAVISAKQPKKGSLVHTTLLAHAQIRESRGTSPQASKVAITRAGHYLAELGSHEVVTCIVICILLLVLVVVAPAVWSNSETRRTAAQEVLDKILRFLRPRH